MRVHALLTTDKDVCCPFCKDGIRNAPTCVCSSCGTSFHSECFATARKCSTFGCVSRISQPQSRQQVDDYYQEILSDAVEISWTNTVIIFVVHSAFLWSVNILNSFGHCWKEYGLMSFLPALTFMGMGYNLYLRAKRIFHR